MKLQRSSYRTCVLKGFVLISKRFNTDMFWSFEVVISGFTLKNRFNADVQSIATCSGYVSKYSPEDDFNVPDSHTLLKYMLNGQKLGI